MIRKIFTLGLCISALIFTNCSTDDGASGPIELIIDGATIAPQLGGPNEQNQIYIDLSTNKTTSVKRDSWDLGFYSGSDFRVVINGSIAMAVTQLSTTDIDAVNATNEEVLSLQPEVIVGSFNPSNLAYVDAFTGAISGTAISQIRDNSSENKVYLVNLGNAVGTETPAIGAISLNGPERGWKKIRILKDGSNYVMQYADLNATTHEEITISKNSDSSFEFFSFNTNTLVNVEPASDKWDLNFTAFTDEVFSGADSFGAYFYGDFVTTNIKSNVGAYKIDTVTSNGLTYDNFTLNNIENLNFVYNDQRVIGSGWRNGGGPNSLPSLKENVFYIIKDTDGNLYKMKFLALTDEAGKRGYPEFIYSLLQ